MGCACFSLLSTDMSIHVMINCVSPSFDSRPNKLLKTAAELMN